MLTFNVVLGCQGLLFRDFLLFFFFRFFFFQSDRLTQYQETHSTVNEEKKGDGLRSKGFEPYDRVSLLASPLGLDGVCTKILWACTKITK